MIVHPHTRVWTRAVPPHSVAELSLAGIPHVVAAMEAPRLADDPAGGVTVHAGGELTLGNDSSAIRTWFVVELSYLADLDAVVDAVVNGGPA